jgi:hypothetical protein
MISIDPLDLAKPCSKTTYSSSGAFACVIDGIDRHAIKRALNTKANNVYFRLKAFMGYVICLYPMGAIPANNGADPVLVNTGSSL